MVESSPCCKRSAVATSSERFGFWKIKTKMLKTDDKLGLISMLNKSAQLEINA